MTRSVAIILLLMILAAGYALWYVLLKVSPHYHPWAPLDLTARSNLVTGYKIYRIKHNPDLCLQALRGTDMQFRPLEDRPGGECPLANIVQVSAAGADFSSSFAASCPLAAGWEIFRHNTLQQAARKHFDQPVVRVEHIGTYACRNVYNRGRLSEHARANAIDITAFVLADGTRVSVAKIGKTAGNLKKRLSCERFTEAPARPSTSRSAPTTMRPTLTTSTSIWVAFGRAGKLAH